MKRECTINNHAWLNNTWLAPYFNYPAVLIIDGDKKELELDGTLYDVSGLYIATNGWPYKIEKLLTFK